MLAFYVLILPEMQAFFAWMVPVSVLMFFLVKLPVWMAILTFMPLYCFILSIFIEQRGLHEFLKAHKRPWRLRDAMMQVLAFFPCHYSAGDRCHAGRIPRYSGRVKLGENRSYRSTSWQCRGQRQCRRSWKIG